MRSERAQAETQVVLQFKSFRSDSLRKTSCSFAWVVGRVRTVFLLISGLNGGVTSERKVILLLCNTVDSHLHDNNVEQLIVADCSESIVDSRLHCVRCVG